MSDLATQIVNSLLKKYDNELVKLFVNNQSQTVTVYKSDLYKITTDVYIDIWNKEMRDNDGNTRWPQLTKEEFKQIANQTFANLPRIIASTSTSGAKGKVTQQFDRSNSKQIVFIQPIAYAAIFKALKTDWISNYNTVLKTYNAKTIQTVKQTAEGNKTATGVVAKGAYSDAATIDDASPGKTAEDIEFRRRMEKLHMDVSTIASARAAAVISTVTSFVGAHSVPTKPGDVIDSITSTWIHPSSGGGDVLSASQVNTTLGTHKMNVEMAGARDWDMHELRKLLIQWTDEVILQNKEGLFKGTGLNSVRNDISKLLVNKLSFGIKGAKVSYKVLREESGSKSKKKNFKGSTSKPPSGPPVGSWQRGKDSKQLSSKAGEIKLHLIAGLRGGAAIRERMGVGPPNKMGRLVNRDTRSQTSFAKSVEIEDVKFTRVNKAVTVRYDYERERYGTFEPGRGTRGLDSPTRDPHVIINETIRDIAKDLMKVRGFSKLGLQNIFVRRPIS